MYFPIIVNICVLTYTTRFDGTPGRHDDEIGWLVFISLDYDRLKHLLPFKQPKADPPVLKKPLGKRLRVIFVGGSFAI